MDTVAFDGRIIFLSEDPDKVTRQLDGADLSVAEARPLRNDISTDEITPIPVLVYYDDELGRHAHVGFETGGRQPIGTDALRDGGFSVIVGGNRYGKGSSREHSPQAELYAGVKLIIAESFERLYRQNCDNLGLFTSTDFGLIDRIRAGEAIPVDDLVAGREPLAAKILRAGGLLGFGRSIAPHVRPALSDPDAIKGPKTLAEKIVSRHAMVTDELPWDLKPGTAGFLRPDWRYFHDIFSAQCAFLAHRFYGSDLDLYDPDSVRSFEDHYSYAHRPEVNAKRDRMPDIRRMAAGHRAFWQKYHLKDHGYLKGEEGSEGISHALMTEMYALPGQVLVGTDSHTPHNGALGCISYGVGSTDMANALMTGLIRITMPETVRVELKGSIPSGVMAKDIVLEVLADSFTKSGGGIGKVYEFGGPAAAQLPVDERTTLTNMTAEMGGLTGIFAPDEQTVRFLKERRGIDFTLEPWMCSDEGATYAHTIEIDCSALSPMLAAPGDPGNGVRVADLKEPVAVNIAYGGSCTAGKREDFDGYHEVLQWAADKGLKVPDGVKLYLQFGTIAVRDYCRKKGYIDAFDKVGAEILQPACGACAGCGPGLSQTPDTVTVSAINRNFPGRSGPGKVWLASPVTVAASAIAGEIVSFDDLKARYA
jgi:3-isopropylmalate/(R)-2-methylmalate dehydratase large subunit